jgi:hypothetical protein
MRRVGGRRRGVRDDRYGGRSGRAFGQDGDASLIIQIHVGVGLDVEFLVLEVLVGERLSSL